MGFSVLHTENNHKLHKLLQVSKADGRLFPLVSIYVLGDQISIGRTQGDPPVQWLMFMWALALSTPHKKYGAQPSQ